MPNTLIEYLYRDDSNYKVPNSAIVKGAFTVQQVDTILSCLADGENFIPCKVGLPEERFGSYTEDDGPYFELTRSGFSHTDAPADTKLTMEQLVKNFEAMKGEWYKYETDFMPGWSETRTPSNVIEMETVLAACQKLLDCNEGDDASENLILGLTAQILDCSTDRVSELLTEYEDEIRVINAED